MKEMIYIRNIIRNKKRQKTDEDLEIKNSRMEIHIDDIENGAIKDRKERKASDGDERLKNEINMEINDIRNKAKDELKLSNQKKDRRNRRHRNGRRNFTS
jgi:hypothetical protein